MTTRRWLALAILWSATLFWSVAGVSPVAADIAVPECPPDSVSTADSAPGTAEDVCPPASLDRVRPSESAGSTIVRNAATVVAAAGLIVIGGLVFRFAHRSKLTG